MQSSEERDQLLLPFVSVRNEEVGAARSVTTVVENVLRVPLPAEDMTQASGSKSKSKANAVEVEVGNGTVTGNALYLPSSTNYIECFTYSQLMAMPRGKLDNVALNYRSLPPWSGIKKESQVLRMLRTKKAGGLQPEGVSRLELLGQSPDPNAGTRALVQIF